MHASLLGKEHRTTVRKGEQRHRTRAGEDTSTWVCDERDNLCYLVFNWAKSTTAGRNGEMLATKREGKIQERVGHVNRRDGTRGRSRLGALSSRLVGEGLSRVSS